MDAYDTKELARQFRKMRNNTIQIAQDIPEASYSFRAAPDVRSVGEELAHIACTTLWPIQAHGIDRTTFMAFEDFGTYRAKGVELERTLTTKAMILEALRRHGDDFAQFLDGLTAEQLAERVEFPPSAQPPSKSRLVMLLGIKEHEMHHRGKLMLIQRMLGIVPHLTRMRKT